MKYERRIRNEGCAIRALEYAFGVSATDEEGEKRLIHLDALNAAIERLEPQIESEEDQRKLHEFVIVFDGRLWQTMIASFRQHQTPLGRALRSHDQQHSIMRESRLLQTVTKRRLKVIGHMTLMEGGHTAFLGVAGGRLIRVSDHNELVPSRRRNTSFAVDIFTPR